MNIIKFNKSDRVIARRYDKADITGVVLAGGQSRRMGGTDKSLLQLGGKPMIAHPLERIKAQVGQLVINTNGDPDQFAGLGYPVAADIVSGFAGPLAGVLTGMRWSIAHKPGARWIVTAAADTPFLPDNLVTKLAAAVAGNMASIAFAVSNNRIQPVVGIWPVALADDLEDYLIRGENRKVLAYVDNYTMFKVPFPQQKHGAVEVDPFFNVNTPEDLIEANSILMETAE